MEWAGNQHGPSLCAGSGALARTPPSVCLSPSASQPHGSLRSTLLFSIQFTLGQIRENKLRTEQTRTCIQSKDGHPFWRQSPQGKLLQFIIFHFLISSSSPALKSQEEPVARTFQRLSLCWRESRPGGRPLLTSLPCPECTAWGQGRESRQVTVFVDRVEFKLPETWKTFSSKADVCGEGHRRGLAAA